jgi:hydroxyacylglutathione hydrolase
MFFKRFYDDGLAQASYLLGCEGTGESLVIDANRDVAQYEAEAAAQGLRITHVTETHIHADYVSGSRELARRTGALLLLSGEGGRDWQYGYAAESGAQLLRDGSRFVIGRVRIDVMHTPGHTPEHLSFLVTDTAAADRPVGLCSGDFLFVGDVGRPDLLERAAHFAGTMDSAARALFGSLKRVRQLPDYVQLWPGHGAGSACGKALGAMPQSTVGYEKISNWALAIDDEDTFVREVLAGQPEPPLYFAEMKRLNRDGPPMLGGFKVLARLDPCELPAELAAGGIVIDIRGSMAFAEGHVPGTLNIPLSKSFNTYAGWLLPYDRDLRFVASVEGDATRAARELAMIGLDRVAGWFSTDAIDAWAASGRPLERVARVTAREVSSRVLAGDVTVIDVRNASEWDEGHLPGAIHVPYGLIASRLAELPRSRPIVLQCQGGTRSAIAASVLLAHGVRDVVNLADGYDEWVREGLPVARG